MATAADYFAMAIHHLQAGDLSLAEPCLQSFLNLSPNHPDALRYLGLIARMRGAYDQALDYLHNSLLVDKTNADTWKYLGDACLDRQEYGPAVAHYEQTLRLRPDYAEALNNLGLALQHVDDFEKAVACFRKALQIIPTSAEVHNNLGNALVRLGKPSQSLKAFQEGLRLDPNKAEIAYNLGTTLHGLGEIDQAIHYYRMALRLKPNYPDASNNLATALKEQGSLVEAIAQYRQTLQFLPYHALTHYNLSELAATGHYSFPPEELEKLKAFMASGNCPPLARSLFCFTLATVLNKEGAYDAAFAYYQEANDLRKRLLEERHQAFDRQKHRTMMNQVMAAYDRTYFQQVKGWGLDTEMPIFIIGMPRSGSTLVEQILASHPRVFGAGELGEVPRLIAHLARPSHGQLSPMPVLSQPSAAREIATDYHARMAQLGNGAERVTIKALENFMHLGVIAALFPKARIIHCRRDALDVCLSCYFQNFHDLDFTWDLEDIATYFATYEKLMAHWSKVLPMPIHEVNYEELVHDPEAICRDMLSCCGLDWDDRCLTFFKTRRVVRTASAVQVRRPMSVQAIGRWKNYHAHLGPLVKALAHPAETLADSPLHQTADSNIDDSVFPSFPISSL